MNESEILGIQKEYRDVKSLLDEYNQNIPPYIEPRQVSIISKIPFKCLALRETAYMRFISLSNAVFKNYNDDNFVPGFVLMRSLLEMVVVLYKLSTEISMCIKSKNVDRLDSFIVKGLVGRKNDEGDVYPINLMAAINEMNIEFKSIKRMYDELTSYCHPNYEGMLSSFGHWDKKEMELRLGQKIKNSTRMYYLITFHTLLTTFKSFYNILVDEIKEVAPVCDEDAEMSKNKTV